MFYNQVLFVECVMLYTVSKIINYVIILIKKNMLNLTNNKSNLLYIRF